MRIGLHVDGAGCPAQRAEERQDQAGRLVQRLRRGRKHQHAEAGDAECEPGRHPLVRALVQDHPRHHAGPDRHRVVDDDDARGVGAQLREGAEQAERHHVQHAGDEQVDPVAAVAAGRNVEAATLYLEQNRQRRRADAVAEQARRPRRQLVERDAQRRPVQAPEQRQQHEQQLAHGGVVETCFGGHRHVLSLGVMPATAGIQSARRCGGGHPMFRRYWIARFRGR